MTVVMGAVRVGVAGDGVVVLPGGMGVPVGDAGAEVGVSVLLGRAVDVAVGVGGADVGVLLGGADVGVGRGVLVTGVQIVGMGSRGRGPGVTVGIGVPDDGDTVV